MRLRDGLVDRFRTRPGLAERAVRLPRLVPLRSARSTLYRTFSWPLIDHLRQRVEISSVGGKLVVDTGDVVGRVLTASGVWELHVTEAFRRRLAPGDVCIDIGAHIGYYTLLASKLVGPGGHVYAFEPSPGVYGRLEKNLVRNDTTLRQERATTQVCCTSWRQAAPATRASVQGFSNPRMPARSRSTPRSRWRSAPSTPACLSTSSAACG